MATHATQVLFLVVGLFHLAACNSYNLVDHLENPGGRASAPPVLKCGGGNCRIFLTISGFNGALGGATGADALCRNDSANPMGAGNGNWKALLAGGGRQACSTTNCQIGGIAENIDWVMYPNTPYFRPTGEWIGTTTAAGIFAFNTNTSISTIGAGAWTGLNGVWQTHADNCSGWTNGTAGSNGRVGSANANDATMLESAAPSCGDSYYLYCVEQ